MKRIITILIISTSLIIANGIEECKSLLENSSVVELNLLMDKIKEESQNVRGKIIIKQNKLKVKIKYLLYNYL